MSIQPQALAEATFTILPDPITGEAVFLRDGVVIQTFKTLQEAFDFGYRYVNAPFLLKTTEEWISTANSKVKWNGFSLKQGFWDSGLRTLFFS